MGIQEYIENQGYKPMRLIYDINSNNELISNIKEWVCAPSKNNSFSTMTNGGLYIIYIKEGYKNIVYGLNEFKKPPTLISSKPINLLKEESRSSDNMNIESDDLMNRVLSNYTAEEVFNDLISK